MGPVSVNINKHGITVPGNIVPTIGITLQVTQASKPGQCGADYNPTAASEARTFSGGLGIQGTGFSINDNGEVTFSVGYERSLLPFVSVGTSPTSVDRRW